MFLKLLYGVYVQHGRRRLLLIIIHIRALHRKLGCGWVSRLYVHAVLLLLFKIFGVIDILFVIPSVRLDFKFPGNLVAETL